MQFSLVRTRCRASHCRSYDSSLYACSTLWLELFFMIDDDDDKWQKEWDIDIQDCLCRKHNNTKGDLWSWKIGLGLGLGLMVLASASSSASKVCPRPRPWPRRFVLDLGLENLSSFNITGWPILGHTFFLSLGLSVVLICSSCSLSLKET